MKRFMTMIALAAAMVASVAVAQCPATCSKEKGCLRVRIVRVYRNGQKSRLQVRQVRMRQAGAVSEGQRRRCQEGLLPEDLSGPGPTEETTWGMPCPTCFFVPFHVHARFPLDLPPFPAVSRAPAA